MYDARFMNTDASMDVSTDVSMGSIEKRNVIHQHDRGFVFGTLVAHINVHISLVTKNEFSERDTHICNAIMTTSDTYIGQRYQRFRHSVQPGTGPVPGWSRPVQNGVVHRRDGASRYSLV